MDNAAEQEQFRDDVASVGSLGDQTRRALYDFVVRQAEPAGRDEAAAAAGVGRTLAAYHLDRMVEDGLLEVSFARRTGRSGPGAGRPSSTGGPPGSSTSACRPGTTSWRPASSPTRSTVTRRGGPRRRCRNRPRTSARRSPPRSNAGPAAEATPTVGWCSNRYWPN